MSEQSPYSRRLAGLAAAQRAARSGCPICTRRTACGGHAVARHNASRSTKAARLFTKKQQIKDIFAAATESPTATVIRIWRGQPRSAIRADEPLGLR